MKDDASKIPHALLCPTCAGPLEPETTYSWIDDRESVFDVGYCARCTKRWAKSRERARWIEAPFLPRCPQCGTHVRFVDVDRVHRGIRYACPFPDHRYAWIHVPRDDRWIRQQ